MTLTPTLHPDLLRLLSDASDALLLAVSYTHLTLPTKLEV